MALEIHNSLARWRANYFFYKIVTNEVKCMIEFHDIVLSDKEKACKALRYSDCLCQ